MAKFTPRYPFFTTSHIWLNASGALYRQQLYGHPAESLFAGPLTQIRITDWHMQLVHVMTTTMSYSTALQKQALHRLQGPGQLGSQCAGA